MADDRLRIYYTKAQIQNGLKTGGGEWMYTDGTEYIGQYHKYSTGEVFSLATFVQGKSRILIPYIDINKKVSDSTDSNIDFEKNFEYDAIKTLEVQKSKKPNNVRANLSNLKIKDGNISRLFAYKVNDGQLIELSPLDFGNMGSPTGLDVNLWKKLTIEWKVQGPDFDVLDSQNNIIQHGIIDANKRTVERLSDEYPTLKNYLTDFRELSQA